MFSSVVRTIFAMTDTQMTDVTIYLSIISIWIKTAWLPTYFRKSMANLIKKSQSFIFTRYIYTLYRYIVIPRFTRFHFNVLNINKAWPVATFNNSTIILLLYRVTINDWDFFLLSCLYIYDIKLVNLLWVKCLLKNK